MTENETLDGPTSDRPNNFIAKSAKDSSFTQEKKTKIRRKFCREIKNKLKVKLGDNFHDINEVGTPIERGGRDHDLRIFLEEEMIDEDTMEEISEMIDKYGLNSEVFFSLRDEFVHGDFKELSAAKSTGEHIAGRGYDPETASAVLGQDNRYYTGLAIYLASSMRSFDEEGNSKPSEIGKEALESIKLSHEGGVGYANLYTAEFIHDYVGEDEISDNSLAKYAVRVKLGKLITQTKGKELGTLQSEYSKAVSSALEKEISPDENLAKLVTKWDKSLSDKDKEMLTQAGKIRSDKLDANTDFREWATEGVLIDSALLNADKRHGNEDAFRALSSHLMVEVFKALDEEAITIETKKTNVILTTEGENNDQLYIIPFNKRNGERNGRIKIVNSRGRDTKIYPGRTIGAVQALSIQDKPATATAITNEEVEMLTVEGKYIRSIFRDPSQAAEILAGSMDSKESRALHILLTQLTRDMIKTLGEITPHTSSPNPIDTHDNIMKGNPLAWFYDETAFGKIILGETEKYKDDDAPPLVVKEYGKDQTLYEAGSPSNGKILFIAEGSVEIEGVGKVVDGVPTNIILEKGFTIGEKALYDNQAVRSAKVNVLAGSKIIEINTDWLMTFALNNEPVNQLKHVSSAFLLHHLAALSTGRVTQRVYSNQIA